jgi:hypothetical protein
MAVSIQKYLQRRWIKLPIEYIEDPIPPDYHRRNRKRAYEPERPAMPPIQSSLTDSILEAMDQAIRAAVGSVSPLLTGIEQRNDNNEILESTSAFSKESESEKDENDYEESPALPPFRFVQIIDPAVIALIGEIVEFFLIHRHKEEDDADVDDMSILEEAFLKKVDHIRKRWVVKPAYILVIQSTVNIMQQRKAQLKNVPCKWTDDDYYENHRKAFYKDGKPDLPYLFQEESSDDDSDDDDDDDDDSVFNVNEEAPDDETDTKESKVPWYWDDNNEKLFRFDYDRYIPPPFRPFVIDTNNMINDKENELWCYSLAQAATQVLLLSLRVQGVVAEEQRTGPSFIHTKAFRDLVAVDPSERLIALIAVGQNSRHPAQRYIEPNDPPNKKKLHLVNTYNPVKGMVVDIMD